MLTPLTPQQYNAIPELCAISPSLYESIVRGIERAHDKTTKSKSIFQFEDALKMVPLPASFDDMDAVEQEMWITAMRRLWDMEVNE